MRSLRGEGTLSGFAAKGAGSIVLLACPFSCGGVPCAERCWRSASLTVAESPNTLAISGSNSTTLVPCLSLARLLGGIYFDLEQDPERLRADLDGIGCPRAKIW